MKKGCVQASETPVHGTGAHSTGTMLTTLDAAPMRMSWRPGEVPARDRCFSARSGTAAQAMLSKAKAMDGDRGRRNL